MPSELAYDLVVVGAGSGNSVVGEGMGDWSVALLDDGEPFGGTCLNAGCIPTKMFVRVADIVTDARDGDRLGVRATIDPVDWPAVRDRIFTRTDGVSRAGRDYRTGQENVAVYRDTHRFVDPHTLVGADGERIRGRRIVVAAGSRPVRLGVPGENDPAVHDSDSIMRIERLPGSMLIVGGGPVAVEFAHVFAALGTEVTLVTRSPRVLAGLDAEVSAAVTRTAAERWRHRQDTVSRIDRRGDGLAVVLASGAEVSVDTVLVAIGRRPNTDRLHAAEAGLDLYEDGRLVTDDRLRMLSGGTPLTDVYALGDVTSAFQLKHVANHQARIVEHNLLNPDDPWSDTVTPVPAAVFTHPQVAHFGQTEAEARAGGDRPVVVTRPYSATAYGWALEDTTSFCKLVVSSDGRILGAHIAGPEASILIQPLVLAASRGLRVPGLVRGMYWPHPAATEVVEQALLAAEAELEERERGSQ